MTAEGLGVWASARRQCGGERSDDAVSRFGQYRPVCQFRRIPIQIAIRGVSLAAGDRVGKS
jgi:hypothetical protein